MQRDPAVIESVRHGRPATISQRGHDLLADPCLNKDAGFPADERDAFGLHGLLPPHVASIEEQLALELEHVRRKQDPLERYIGLAALQDRNETLFYRLLTARLEEFLPIVYTPTVGRACQEYSHILRRPRGLWLTPDDRDRIPELLRNASDQDVRLLVVTDNERILGLGDLGAGGMAIPVGKLSLYSAAAGIHPGLTLPVSLDVGTDRQALLDDPLYLGHRAPRLRGESYDAFVERFVDGVRAVFPRAVLQWEDFKRGNALHILERYRDRLPTFNDDVQGTGAVVLAGVLSALKVVHEPLGRQRIVFVGAGGAGIGIARMMRLAMERDGASPAEARAAATMLDSQGLIFEGRAGVDADKAEFALPRARMAELDFPAADFHGLQAVIARLHPTVLIGTTGAPGCFTESAIREMARHVRVPLVFPLSNPTSSCEAAPDDVIAWTEGRALVATGSPFEPVRFGSRYHVIGQANNAFIFPGMGLGAIVAEVPVIPDDLFLVAAETLAGTVTHGRLNERALYPPIGQLRTISRRIAIATARAARDLGIGRALADDELEAAVDQAMWWPAYVPYRYRPAA